jgi:hypothetical protein
MKLKLAYSFFLNSKTGGAWNLIWCFVLIYVSMYLYLYPFILFLIGYLAEVARSLHDDDTLQDCPPFEWSRWKQYLKDGLWQLIPLTLFISIAGGTTLVILVLRWEFAEPIIRKMTSNEQHQARAFVAVMLGCICMAITIATFFYLWSIVFHIQVCGRLRVMHAMAFVGLMSWRVGVRVVLMILLQSLIAIPTIFLAYQVVFPIPFLITIILMAQVHLMAQVYRLYLDRGGHPIEAHSLGFDDDD